MDRMLKPRFLLRIGFLFLPISLLDKPYEKDALINSSFIICFLFIVQEAIEALAEIDTPMLNSLQNGKRPNHAFQATIDCSHERHVRLTLRAEENNAGSGSDMVREREPSGRLTVSYAVNG